MTLNDKNLKFLLDEALSCPYNFIKFAGLIDPNTDEPFSPWFAQIPILQSKAKVTYVCVSRRSRKIFIWRYRDY